MYLMSCTRPDIAFTISCLSRFTSNPSENHKKAILRVLRYLRYTRDYRLHYSRDPVVLEGYSDASWISDTQDYKGTSGHVFTLGGGVVSWKSSRQTIITRSTMEFEFAALDKIGEEAEWLRQFLEDIPEWPKPIPTGTWQCFDRHGEVLDVFVPMKRTVGGASFGFVCMASWEDTLRVIERLDDFMLYGSRVMVSFEWCDTQDSFFR
ncbi:hypothetical protein GQ457_10G007710 [Hibiscus cannabinus]